MVLEKVALFDCLLEGVHSLVLDWKERGKEETTKGVTLAGGTCIACVRVTDGIASGLRQRMFVTISHANKHAHTESTPGL